MSRATSHVVAVIPNKDGAGLVGRCVEAALATGVHEVIVVDDGSADDSAAEAAAAGARVLRSPGRGFAAAVNAGVRATDAGLVLILNSDCFLERDAPARLAAAMDADDRLGLCGALLHEPDGSPTKSFGRTVTLGNTVRSAVGLGSAPSRPAPSEGVLAVEHLPLACALARRRAWEDVGGLDERYGFYFEDYDLGWRLARHGWTLAVCADATAEHVGGASSSRRNPQAWFGRYNESRGRYLRKRYPRGWLVYAVVWLPAALLRALTWLPRGTEGRAWARAYAAAAFRGLPLGSGGREH